MAEKRCSASSPCFADEMDDAYAGYLAPDELAAALAHLIGLAASLGPLWMPVRAAGESCHAGTHSEGGFSCSQP